MPRNIVYSVEVGGGGGISADDTWKKIRERK
jgi:hypothetical protein